jgi:hypothetical protein
VTAAVPAEALGRPVEIWFTDEARVGQQGTLTRIWAKRGSRPRALRDRRFEWAYLFGAICPERRIGAAIVMPEVNVEAMNEHLAEISRHISVGAIALLVRLPHGEWRGEIRALCSELGDPLQAGPCFGWRCVANRRVKALSIVKDLDVIEYGSLGLFSV